MIAVLLALLTAATQADAPSANSAAEPTAVQSAPVAAAPASSAPVDNAPATVTLSGTFNLDDVCAEIERQTGNKITDYRQRLSQQVSNPKFKLEIKNAPFWQALDALLDSTHMTVYAYSGKDGLAIVNGTADELPRSKRAIYVGPLRLEVTRIIAERQPGLKTPGALRLSLAVAWEPRLEPLSILQPLTQIQAVDDQGHAMKLEGGQATLESPIEGGGTGVELVLPLVPPPRSVNAIASLTGKLTVSLPDKMEAFEFDKLADATQPGFKSREQKKGAAAVFLDQLRKNNDIWELLVRVRFDDAAKSDPDKATNLQHDWIMQNDAYLLAADHHRIDHAGFDTVSETGNELGFNYKFELPAGVEGYTFVYKMPTAIHLLPVDYEFKNLQLP